MNPLPANSLPLVIGVAAPSDPGESGPVRAAVEAFFRELARLCPHTPLRLVSCRGDVGDQRVCGIAQKMNPVVECVDRPPASLAEAARHCHLIVAVWDGDEKNPADGVAELVRFKLHGAPAAGKAGWSPLDPPETGPVYLFRPSRPASPCEVRFPPPPDADPDETASPAVARRGADPNKAASPAVAHQAERGYKAILRCVDGFNRDAAGILPSLDSVQADSRASLLLEGDDWTKPADERRRIAEGREAQLPPAARDALGRFAAADALALYFQRRTHGILGVLFIAALLAMGVFEWFGHSAHKLDVHSHPWWLLAYLALWLAALGLWWLFVRRTDYQNRRQDYRALAEALRVQFYWRVGGLPDAAEDHYLRKQRSELEWIRYALHTWNAFGADGEGGAGPPAGLERLGLVARCWVEGQRGYFRKTARREHGRHFCWRGAGDGLFLINLAGAAALLLLLLVFVGRLEATTPGPPDGHKQASSPSGTESSPAEKELREVEHYWVIGLGLTVIGAALCVGYTERLAHAEHGKQYLTMSVLYGRACAALRAALDAKPPDLDRARLVLRELGKEALAENADWLLMHRERPLEVPRP